MKFCFRCSCMKMNLKIALGLLIFAVCKCFVHAETCKCTSSNFSASLAPGMAADTICTNSVNGTPTQCSFYYKACTGTCNRQSDFSYASSFYSWVQAQQQKMENFDCENKTQTCPLSTTSKCKYAASECPVKAINGVL